MGEQLLFDSTTWIVWAAPFMGILAAGLSRRRDPSIRDGKVLRHDGPATSVLLVSGVMLGFLFVPRMVSGQAGAAVWFDVHFYAVAVFLFGTFYYAANTVLSGRLKEHLPHSIAGSLKDAVAHYKAVFTKSEFPGEGKYFASEHLTYPIAVVGSALMIVTGLFKVAAHAWDLSAGLMGVMTFTHDLTTVVMAVFFVAHVVMGAVVPWSWPVLRSMFTGYVTEEYVKSHHAGWYRELTGKAESTD